MQKQRMITLLTSLSMALALGMASVETRASSHMDAPLITLDDPANTTDVYAFVADQDGRRYLATALAVNPFEEPGIGPNAYRFDDDVRYEIHVSLGEDLAKGKPTLSYRFDFTTEFANRQTILQSYLGVIQEIHDDAQNLRQTYRLTRIDRREKEGEKLEVVLAEALLVPPNNQGIATPFYNQNDDGEQPAKDGVATAAELDRYTVQAVTELESGHLVFAGQRDDGFYADIQAIFDLLSLRSGDDRFDSQGGFNVHTIALNIPLEELGGELQSVGVYATTSRRKVQVIRSPKDKDLKIGEFVQVGRQGNPLFAEALVALEDKDIYNRTEPSVDSELFAKYALEPELARLINALLFDGQEVALENERTDIAGIFIPDMIRVDLSTGPARLAGGGPDDPANPDDEGFSRLGIFGGDTLVSRIQPGFGAGTVPGGFPNGRRWGGDVVDIVVSALLSDLRDPGNPKIVVADGIDNVDENDIAYSKTFPYAATPQNGRNHGHH